MCTTRVDCFELEDKFLIVGTSKSWKKLWAALWICGSHVQTLFIPFNEDYVPLCHVVSFQLRKNITCCLCLLRYLQFCFWSDVGEKEEEGYLILVSLLTAASWKTPSTQTSAQHNTTHFECRPGMARKTKHPFPVIRPFSCDPVTLRECRSSLLRTPQRSEWCIRLTG